MARERIFAQLVGLTLLVGLMAGIGVVVALAVVAVT